MMIDIREFHPDILDELDKNEFFSFREITHCEKMELVDPILSYIFYHYSHRFETKPIGRYNQIFLYFLHDDFIELFDDLFLSFLSFLDSKGIELDKKYRVNRIDNFSTMFAEVK